MTGAVLRGDPPEVEVGRQGAGHHLRVPGRGAHRVDADTERPELERRGLREAAHRELARRVGRGARRHEDAVDRRDVDDRPAAAGTHRCDHRLDPEERGRARSPRTPAGRCRPTCRRWPTDARWPRCSRGSRRRSRPPDECLPVVLASHVAVHVAGVVAELGDERAAPFVEDVGDDDGRPFRHEGRRDRGAGASGPARDDRRPACQPVAMPGSELRPTGMSRVTRRAPGGLSNAWSRSRGDPVVAQRSRESRSAHSVHGDAETPRTRGRRPRAPTGYRPHLDGLRAVAVYLVVMFHAGLDRFHGGFIGVDVFFVLSGYLVTQLLLRDIDATAGSASAGSTPAVPPPAAGRVRRRWSSRPPCTPRSPRRRSSSTRSAAFRAAFLYVANWFFIRSPTTTSAADIDANPVVHFWSLAVEEQFYLVWPLAARRARSASRGARRGRMDRGREPSSSIGLACSFVARCASAHDDLNRAYYGTTRARTSCSPGACLALDARSCSRSARVEQRARRCAVVALAMLVLLATSIVDVGADHPRRARRRRHGAC